MTQKKKKRKKEIREKKINDRLTKGITIRETKTLFEQQRKEDY